MNNAAAEPRLLIKLLPFIAAAVAIAAFFRLGLWQLDRAEQKEALVAGFENDLPHRQWQNRDETLLFENIEVRARLLGERQLLLDNITRNGRVGYYVITPAELQEDHRLLLVNRGWVDKLGGLPKDAFWEGRGDWSTIRGRVGRLPRAALQTSDAFADSSDWPRIGVFPTQADVEAELGEELMPFVLLLDDDQKRGFGRNWQPAKSGAMTHYGYAFQWFAMALTVVAISGWQLNKRMKN